jgi:hypothetical protein
MWMKTYSETLGEINVNGDFNIKLLKILLESHVFNYALYVQNHNMYLRDFNG